MRERDSIAGKDRWQSLAQMQAANEGRVEEALDALAGLIQPLPEHVLPSSAFLENLRARILALPGEGLGDASLRAA